MKIAGTLLIISAFLTVLLAGFLVMDHQALQAHQMCFAALGQSAVCPESGFASAILNFHFQVFQGLSSALIFDWSIMASLLSVLLLLVGINLLVTQSENNVMGGISFHSQVTQFAMANQPLRHWQALLEKRDPAVSF
ncbi:MAG TPA: hypothetical protein VJH70_00215 [Candidatus Paceibacterota bacterium]